MIYSTRVIDIMRHYASVPLAVVSLCLFILFTSVGFSALIGPLLGATIGAFVAIVLLLGSTKFETSTFDHLSPSPDTLNYRIPIIITNIYVISIVWIYRFTLHTRPLIHYLVFGAFAGFIAYETGTGASRRRVVIQILTLTFFTYWSSQFAFPDGSYAPDVPGQLLPVIQDGLREGVIHELFLYLGHLIYVLVSVLITGLSSETGYYVMATAVLTGTVLIISILDQTFPALDQKVSLYGAIFFGCMSWTLGRGLHPDKLNFFYVITLVTGVAMFRQFLKMDTVRWTAVGVIAAVAILIGHRFSAGAALVFVLSIGAFAAGTAVFSPDEYPNIRGKPAVIFACAYGVAILGTPLHGNAIIYRFSNILISVFQPVSSASGSGGIGRYAAVPLEALLFSTSSQGILFGLAVLGVAIALRRGRWEYDLIFFWLAALSALLAISLFFNTSDIQPQRFYALIGVFGLNIFAGVALNALHKWNGVSFGPHTISAIVCVFAILSLGSPVAGMHLSFVSDDVAHNPWFDTGDTNAGDRWVMEYQGNESTMFHTMPGGSELPLERTSVNTGSVNISAISKGDRYVYTTWTASTGVSIGGGQGLGDRFYVFLKFDPPPEDNKVYSNGKFTAYQKWLS